MPLVRTYVKCAKDCKRTPKNSPKVKNCLVCVRNKQGGNGPVDETELDLCGHATPAQFLLCSYPNWIYIRLGSWNIKTCEYVSGTGECVKGSIDSPILVSNNETLKSNQNTVLTNASVTDA